MATKNIDVVYKKWLGKAVDDIDLIKELKKMSNEEKEDAFYRDLEFGTAGLRGVIGAGTNRMNIYTVARASQGIADYILKNCKGKKKSVAIAYDSRIKSDLFAQTAARVFAANDIKVYIYPYLSPVPTLSFAVRYLSTGIGVMITASHNPSKYNGYKVYGDDGCQITEEVANTILDNIGKVDTFSGIKWISFDEGFDKKLIEYIKPSVMTAFIEEVKKQSLLGSAKINKDVSIVYSPLNGTGLIPVTRTLKELGYTNITIVKEQQFPDGYFPTCSYPNPEIHDAMKLGMEYAKNHDADLLIATDPDCDRVGIAVKDDKGEFRLFSGNETGTLLLDYICSRRKALKLMPSNPTCVKTIVTTALAKKVADNYKVTMVDVLTGFKYIGEQIRKLEKEKRATDYIFGFEESYGVLSGTYVRDKDAVNGATLIVDMFAYYKSKGISLIDKLNELYKKYGYTLNTLYSFEFEGEKGFTQMQNYMSSFRKGLSKIGSLKVEKLIDFKKGVDGLPKSNVLKFVLEKDSYVIVRPSGTEPKLKTYVSVSAKDITAAKNIESDLHKFLNDFLKK